MPASTEIAATVTLNLTVTDPAAVWEHALEVYAARNSGRPDSIVHDEFITISGKPKTPNLVECLRMIYDPGEPPPGQQIEDSYAKLQLPEPQ